MMKFYVVTLFPEMIMSYVGDSILGRAIKGKHIAVKTYNPRDFTKDKWARVDRRPYAGGPGMVLEAESLLKAVEKARGPESKRKTKKTKIIFFAPEGKQFTNVYARQLAKKYDEIIMIAGRYEGVDARVKKILKAETVTVGPYVLTGGEVPAMIVIDAVSRQIPGVLGDFASLEEDRIASPDVYTRPEVLKWKGKNYRVPKVLLGGNHKLIEAWKKTQLGDAPSVSKNRQLVLDILADEVRGDIASAQKKMTKDYTMTWVYKSGGTLFPRTKNDIQKDMKEAYVISGREYHLINVTEAEDVVMVELIESYPDPKTKKVYRTPLVLVLEMKNGKIQTGRHYCDPALSYLHLTEAEVHHAYAKKKTPKIIK